MPVRAGCLQSGGSVDRSDETKAGYPSRPRVATFVGSGHLGGTSLFELPLSLSPGRYVLTVDLAPTGAGVIFAETVVNGEIVGKWYVDHDTFVQNCRDIAFGVGARDAVSYRIGTITDTELALNVEEVRVEQIGGMAAPIPTVF